MVFADAGAVAIRDIGSRLWFRVAQVKPAVDGFAEAINQTRSRLFECHLQDRSAAWL